jgi:hypothetical protein
LSPAGTTTAPAGAVAGPVNNELTPQTRTDGLRGALPEPDPGGELGGEGVGGGATTVRDCCTWVAATKLAEPAWLASITHRPTARNCTVELETLHAFGVEDASIDNTTGLPEAPPVAATW